MDVLELLRRLVEIKSPSGGEGEIIEFLSRLLSEIGYKPLIVEGYGVKDLILESGSDLWVVTHLDTVPFKRGFSYDGRYAYGTGVCDTKASIAAIVLALEEIDGLNFNVALLSDEEEGGRGSRVLVERFPPSKAVVMEPTSLKIANVHYGSLEIVAEFKGKPSHGATPELGVNAIELAIEAIRRLKDEMDPRVKVLVQEIRGGGEEYVVPDSCRVRLDFTFPPSLSVGDVREMVKGIIGEFEVLEGDDGFESGEVSEILESAIRNAGYRPEFCEMPSWTDAINLHKSGWDAVVFGPGELGLCHTEFERVLPDEVLKAKEILISLNKIIE